MLLGAALILVTVGVVLSIAKPGDLGRGSGGAAPATSTTPTSTAPATSTPAASTTPTTAAPATSTSVTTATTGSSGITATTGRPGSGLGQAGAAAAETTTAATGGESMIGAALVMLGLGLALRRARLRVDAA